MEYILTFYENNVRLHKYLLSDAPNTIDYCVIYIILIQIHVEHGEISVKQYVHSYMIVSG